MTNSLIKKLDEFFKDPKALTMAQMEGFVHETIKFFEHIRSTMETGTEDEKKLALQESQELQEKLQLYSQQAIAKSGMSEEEIKNMLAKGNFAAMDMKRFKNAELEIDNYKSKVASKPKTKHHEKWGHKI